MNGLIEYIILHHFGTITLGFFILIASILLRNTIRQAISKLAAHEAALFRMLQTPQCEASNQEATDKTIDESNKLRVLSMDAKKENKPKLEGKEFEKVFGFPEYHSEEKTEPVESVPVESVPVESVPVESMPEKPESETTEEKSLGEKLRKAARGDKRGDKN